MLIQFGVENYGSIKDEQILSLVASNYYHDNDSSVLEPELPGLSRTRLVRGAALYGPNASGKTTLIGAMNLLRMLVVGFGVGGPEVSLPHNPFRLDAARRDDPTKFFVSFAHEGIRYEYSVHYVATRIVFEKLSAYPRGKEQVWFERRWDRSSESHTLYRPSGNLKVSAALLASVRPNALLLSVGAQLNNPQLTKVYEWFAASLKVVNAGVLNPGFSVDLLKSSSSISSPFMNLLQHADLGVVNAAVESMKPPPELIEQLSTWMRPDALAAVAASNVSITFGHKGLSDVVPIDFANESAGTQRLFALAGPWLDILEHGYTAFFDELDASLHPILVRELLNVVFSPETNPKGAQVVFTTHDPYLLAGSILRRDQIWFTEKDTGGATHLYPLTDYKPRPKESRVSGYLAGRYGAVPMIPDGLGL